MRILSKSPLEEGQLKARVEKGAKEIEVHLTIKEMNSGIDGKRAYEMLESVGL